MACHRPATLLAPDQIIPVKELKQLSRGTSEVFIYCHTLERIRRKQLEWIAYGRGVSFDINIFLGWILAFLDYGIIVYIIFLSDKKLPDYLWVMICGILGMMVLSITTAALNFFMPITLAVSIVIWAIGLILFAAFGRKILTAIDKYDIILLFIAGMALFLLIPMVWNDWYDTGLYF